MMGIDPGALTSVATLAGSVAAGLVARRVLGRLDAQRDERHAQRAADPAPVASRPLIRPAVPAGGRR